MSEELNRIFGQLPSAASYGPLELIFAILMTCLYVGIIGWTYSATYTGVTYSRNFYQVLLIMAVVTCVIMVVIGSNIARAFSLVGALSIVRFRTAVKDGKETAFVFFAIAAGMACGTRMYLEAGVLTVMLSGVSYLLHRLQLDSQSVKEELLRLKIRAASFDADALAGIVRSYCRSCVLVGTEQIEVDTEQIEAGKAFEVTFLVKDFDGSRKNRFDAELRDKYERAEAALIDTRLRYVDV